MFWEGGKGTTTQDWKWVLSRLNLQGTLQAGWRPWPQLGRDPEVQYPAKPCTIPDLKKLGDNQCAILSPRVGGNLLSHNRWLKRTSTINNKNKEICGRENWKHLRNLLIRVSHRVILVQSIQADMGRNTRPITSLSTRLPIHPDESRLHQSPSDYSCSSAGLSPQKISMSLYYHAFQKSVNYFT